MEESDRFGDRDDDMDERGNASILGSASKGLSSYARHDEVSSDEEGNDMEEITDADDGNSSEDHDAPVEYLPLGALQDDNDQDDFSEFVSYTIAESTTSAGSSEAWAEAVSATSQNVTSPLSIQSGKAAAGAGAGDDSSQDGSSWADFDAMPPPPAPARIGIPPLSADKVEAIKASMARFTLKPRPGAEMIFESLSRNKLRLGDEPSSLF